ncbi:hypothetical protein GJV14_13375 [Enterobacteriaceae bacterium RIT697]|uniref:flavin reductase n=1 Tax=Pantoea endophytica TaxID=92488 RepID=UPI0012AE8288|nr:hypothetical protein [Enterobacteriaceae bacterium RIT697]
MANRFESHSWSTLHTGSPALDEALVNFDCEITEVNTSGTHSVLFAKVKKMRNGKVLRA